MNKIFIYSLFSFFNNRCDSMFDDELPPHICRENAITNRHPQKRIKWHLLEFTRYER